MRSPSDSVSGAGSRATIVLPAPFHVLFGSEGDLRVSEIWDSREPPPDSGEDKSE
jgi:hypothetical protein